MMRSPELNESFHVSGCNSGRSKTLLLTYRCGALHLQHLDTLDYRGAGVVDDIKHCLARLSSRYAAMTIGRLFKSRDVR